MHFVGAKVLMLCMVCENYRQKQSMNLKSVFVYAYANENEES